MASALDVLTYGLGPFSDLGNTRAETGGMDRSAARDFLLADAIEPFGDGRLGRIPVPRLLRMQFQIHRDEFVFRWNRRRHGANPFDRLLGLGPVLEPAL